MKATVVFKIGETEIRAIGGVPVSIPEGAGRDNMTMNNAISKVKEDLGIDLYKLDVSIKENAKVIY